MFDMVRFNGSCKSPWFPVHFSENQSKGRLMGFSEDLSQTYEQLEYSKHNYWSKCRYGTSCQSNHQLWGYVCMSYTMGTLKLVNMSFMM